MVNYFEVFISRTVHLIALSSMSITL